MRGRLIGSDWTSSEPLSDINIVPLVDVLLANLIRDGLKTPIIRPTPPVAEAQAAAEEEEK